MEVKTTPLLLYFLQIVGETTLVMSKMLQLYYVNTLGHVNVDQMHITLFSMHLKQADGISNQVG